MGLQLIYSVLNGFNEVTLFASIFSILSITLSIFEYFSASVILSSETISVISLSLNSKELSTMNNKFYKSLCNRRLAITTEMSKILNIDKRSIELLLPIRTKNGLNLTFYIRSKLSHANNNNNNNNSNDCNNQQQQVMKLICNEVESGYLAKAIRVGWNLTVTPTISNLETKELNPDKNLDGNKNNEAAVISIRNQSVSSSNTSTEIQTTAAASTASFNYQATNSNKTKGSGSEVADAVIEMQMTNGVLIMNGEGEGDGNGIGKEGEQRGDEGDDQLALQLAVQYKDENENEQDEIVYNYDDIKPQAHVQQQEQHPFQTNARGGTQGEASNHFEIGSMSDIGVGQTPQSPPFHVKKSNAL